MFASVQQICELSVISYENFAFVYHSSLANLCQLTQRSGKLSSPGHSPEVTSSDLFSLFISFVSLLNSMSLI